MEAHAQRPERVGDLEAEAGGLYAGPAQDFRDMLDQLAIGKLTGGEVHRDSDMRPVAVVGVPSGGLSARLAEDPPAQLEDEAALFGDRDELRGREQTALGVLPADQGLDAFDLAVGDRHDRLVEQPQLFAFDRAAQLSLDRESLQRA